MFLGLGVLVEEASITTISRTAEYYVLALRHMPEMLEICLQRSAFHAQGNVESLTLNLAICSLFIITRIDELIQHALLVERFNKSSESRFVRDHTRFAIRLCQAVHIDLDTYDQSPSRVKFLISRETFRH